MKLYLFICLSFFSQLSIGQSPYKINYSKPTTLQINDEYEYGKEKMYEVEFLNERDQPIKLIQRTPTENHSAKTGYVFNETISYYFYKDSLLSQEIVIRPRYRIVNKTDYTYNENNQPLGYASYSLTLKISKDSFATIIDKDLLLNNPSLFPSANFTLETKIVKKYEGNKLVYKCYYERYGELKTAMPAREQYYKYNDQGQLIEHVSNPKSDAGGTAFLRSTYIYNNNNQVTMEESYSDGRHQCTTEYEYNDSSIVKTIYFLDDKGEKHYYLRNNKKEPNANKTVYARYRDGNYYDEYGSRFSLAGEIE